MDRFDPTVPTWAVDDFVAQRRKREDKEGSTSGEREAFSARARDGAFYIEARLSQQEVAAFKATAPSDAVREAWTHGLSYPEAPQRGFRLRLLELPDAVCEEADESLHPLPVPQEIFDEGLAWWEARANESGTVQPVAPR